MTALGSMLTWNTLKAAGLETGPSARTTSSLVPAPLDPRLSPISALGSMLTWNALKAVRFETGSTTGTRFPLHKQAELVSIRARSACCGLCRSRRRIVASQPLSQGLGLRA